MTTKWKDLKNELSPERRERVNTKVSETVSQLRRDEMADPNVSNEEVVDMDEVLSQTDETDVDDTATEPDATLGEDSTVEEDVVEPDASIKEE